MKEVDRNYNRAFFWKAAEHFDLKLSPIDIAEQADNYVRRLPIPAESSFVRFQTDKDLENIEPFLNKNMFMEGFFSVHFTSPPNTSRLLSEAVKLGEHFTLWKGMTADFYASHTGDVSQEASQTVSNLTLSDLHEYANLKLEGLREKLLLTSPNSVERADVNTRYKTWDTYKKISLFATIKEARSKGDIQ